MGENKLLDYPYIHQEMFVLLFTFNAKVSNFYFSHNYDKFTINIGILPTNMHICPLFISSNDCFNFSSHGKQTQEFKLLYIKEF